MLLCQRARLPSTNFKTGGCWKLIILDNAGVQQDAFAPDSSTAAHTTAPALPPRAARCRLLVAQSARPGCCRGAATAGETSEHDCSSRLRGPRDGQDLGGGPGAGSPPDALAPPSTITALHNTTLALASLPAQSGPLDAPPVGFGHARARSAASVREPTNQDYSSALAGPRDRQTFDNKNQVWMPEVCWMTLPLPLLQQQRLANSFDVLLLEHSRSLQPCPRPLLVPAPCMPRLFRLVPPSLVLLCQRARTPPDTVFVRPAL